MPGLRDYSPGARAALVTLSRGACYAPGCGEPIVRLADGDYYINYEIAHIRGAKEHGPRYDPKMSDAKRKSFPNLILLCIVHHKRVDGTHRDKYTPDTLLKWKMDREAGGQGALVGLTRMTEDALEAVLIEAFQAKQNEILEILGRLEANDKEAAVLLKEMLDEVGRFREYGSLVDPDSAIRLYHAASDLMELDLTRNALQLSEAASNLEILPNAVDHLDQTLRSGIDSLIATISQLRELIARLDGMEGRW